MILAALILVLLPLAAAVTSLLNLVAIGFLSVYQAKTLAFMTYGLYLINSTFFAIYQFGFGAVLSDPFERQKSWPVEISFLIGYFMLTALSLGVYRSSATLPEEVPRISVVFTLTAGASIVAFLLGRAFTR